MEKVMLERLLIFMLLIFALPVFAANLYDDPGSVSVDSAACTEIEQGIYKIAITGKASGPVTSIVHASSNPNFGVDTIAMVCTNWSSTDPNDGIRSKGGCKRKVESKSETATWFAYEIFDVRNRANTLPKEVTAILFQKDDIEKVLGYAKLPLTCVNLSSH